MNELFMLLNYLNFHSEAIFIKLIFVKYKKVIKLVDETHFQHVSEYFPFLGNIVI